MWIYDFPFCCESGKMSQIHVFRGVSETHININKKNILALVLAIMMSPIHGLFSKGQNWIWRIASTEKVAAWKFKYCVKVFILIVSNYSWLVRTYSVRTRVWFTVFSNDIFRKKLIDRRGRLVKETSVDQLLEEEFHITKLWILIMK